MFEKDTETLKSMGAEITTREIRQQPELWEGTLKIYDDNIDAIKSFVERARVLGGTDERVPRFSDALDILAAAHVPVVVEVKASPDRRRGELCRKVLGIIDAHTGNFCVESFDPFIVAWFRFHAPDLLRGQLTAQRENLGGGFGAWLSSRMLIGCIGRPQFIAHRAGKKSLGVKLAELLSDRMIFVYFKNDIRLNLLIVSRH